MEVRMQTSTASQFKGSWDCLKQTLQKEGWSAVYKGSTPPLIGWIAMDSTMLGTYTATLDWFRRRTQTQELPLKYHALAGLAAGSVVSIISTPIEQIKARLQVQYQADKSLRTYSGPIDAAAKIWKNNAGHNWHHGMMTGWTACWLFRLNFWGYWFTYEYCARKFRASSWIPTSSVPFWAAGCASQSFWLMAYPMDVVKNRMMSQPDVFPRLYPSVASTIRSVWKEAGWRGFWRGFIPCMLRSFPTNGAAVFVFDKTLTMIRGRGV
jgi:solute carrier family 25 carnitine/acylcarnitine transporter 20/29